MPEDEIKMLAFEIITECAARGLTLGTVESCTGGLIAGALTAIPGSSAVVMAGLVTYSNGAKTALARVPAGLIADHGAVSAEVARAMAEGGRDVLDVDIAVAVTGIAGPGGGSAAKPVGLVHCALARAGHATVQQVLNLGDIGRDKVRHATVAAALTMILEGAHD